MYEQPATFDLIINIKMATPLGLIMATTLQIVTDEVIE
jgi:hypothetical protein